MPPSWSERRLTLLVILARAADRQIGNATFEGTAREVLRMQIPGLFHPLNLRLAEDGDGELYVLTKGDGMIREVRRVQ